MNLSSANAFKFEKGKILSFGKQLSIEIGTHTTNAFCYIYVTTEDIYFKV